MYEGLVTVDAGGKIIPGVAENWRVSPDYREYHFRLRRDARWSNGDPVVAADFVRAFRHVAQPATASSSILTMPVASPRHTDAAEQPISNGPYKLENRAPMGLTRLGKNDQFHAADSLSITSVEYYPIVEADAELNRFRAGELDITHTVPANRMDLLSERHGDALRIARSLALYYLAFDLTEPPFDNPGLRKALSLAIDRRALVEVTGRGELPAFGIVPPGVASYAGVSYDWADLGQEERVQLARESFAAAGYSIDDPLRLTFLYDAGDIHETVALAVADMWRNVLGIEVTFDKREWMFFLEARKDRSDWEVMRFSWFGDYDDATTFTDIFRSGNVQNLPGYRNPDYDRSTAEAATETDPDKRARKLAVAERILLDDYAVAPLYSVTTSQSRPLQWARPRCKRD